MRASTETTPRNPYNMIIQENHVAIRANSIISRILVNIFYAAPTKNKKKRTIPEIIALIKVVRAEEKIIISPNTNHTPRVLSIFSITFLTPSGAIAYKSLDPSSGGIGKILNTKNPKFTNINCKITVCIIVPF